MAVNGCEKLREILRTILVESNEEYAILVAEKVDHESFLMLDKGTLKEMGIKIGPRLKILQYINSLKKEEAPLQFVPIFTNDFKSLENAGCDAEHDSMPVECSNSNGSLIGVHVAPINDIDPATDIDNFHDGSEVVECSPRGDTDACSSTNKDESICDEPRLVQYWNLKVRLFSLEDMEKYNAITTYKFSLTCDKRMDNKVVIVCFCSACKFDIDIGKYPGDAVSHGIGNLLKHRESRTHQYYVELAAGRKGKENSIAAEVFEMAQSLTGKKVFILKEGFIQCRMCPSTRISLFGKGSAENHINDHLRSNGHISNETKKSYIKKPRT